MSHLKAIIIQNHKRAMLVVMLFRLQQVRNYITPTYSSGSKILVFQPDTCHFTLFTCLHLTQLPRINVQENNPDESPTLP